MRPADWRVHGAHVLWGGLDYRSLGKPILYGTGKDSEVVQDAASAMVVAHIAVSIAFSGNEREATVFGIGVEGSGAEWINSIKFNIVARFFEPWAFVATGGVLAPSFPGPAIVLAVPMVLFHVVAPALYLVGGNPASATGVALLRGAMGIVGAIAGIAAAWRYHSNE